jgi:hypothetical protein
MTRESTADIGLSFALRVRGPGRRIAVVGP